MKGQVGFKSLAVLVPCGWILALTTACGSSEDFSRTSVYGGSKTSTGAWQNVIALTQGRSGMHCTGTAISPKLVLTAAHCVRGIRPSSLSVYVGDGKEGGRVEGQHQAKSIKVSPKYKGSNSEGYDIAYVLLSKPLDLPANAYTPVLSAQEEREELLAVGKTARVIGFGNRNDGGFGVKYEVDAKISRVTDLEAHIGGSGKDSCQGDSGGPVFGKLLNGEWRVYGVTSRGGSCGNGGIYGLMHTAICWVQNDSGVDLGVSAETCEESAASTDETKAEETDSSSPSVEVPSIETDDAEAEVEAEEESMKFPWASGSED